MHALRVVPEPTAGVDLDAAERAAGDLLRALGIDTDTDNLRATPGRMARAWDDVCATSISRNRQGASTPEDSGIDPMPRSAADPGRRAGTNPLWMIATSRQPYGLGSPSSLYYIINMYVTII